MNNPRLSFETPQIGSLRATRVHQKRGVRFGVWVAGGYFGIWFLAGMILEVIREVM
jgi:hypothetical protein